MGLLSYPLWLFKNSSHLCSFRSYLRSGTGTARRGGSFLASMAKNLSAADMAGEIAALRAHLQPIHIGDPRAFDSILERVTPDIQFVLIGEASHGTHDFYAARIEMTKRLIMEKGFQIVVAEADWPDSLLVHKYVRGKDSIKNADEALSGFKRFPTWMWRNKDVLQFVEWMKAYNAEELDKSARNGVQDAESLKKAIRSHGGSFFGMDLYSLHKSIDSVIEYLERVSPKAAREARKNYSCFQKFGIDPHFYGLASTIGIARSCKEEVLMELHRLRSHAADFIHADADSEDDSCWAEDARFFAEQNALVVKDVEAYYRAMFDEDTSSWNLRDKHMVRCCEAIIQHFTEKGATAPAKIIIWAHNSHVGDARHVDKVDKEEVTVGQLLREKYGDRVFAVGFSTYVGTVTAAEEWGAPPQKMNVRPGLPGSYEALFHEVGVPEFVLNNVREVRLQRRLERAIGVIYRPPTERWSHYRLADISHEYDALVFVDRTSAVEPLEEEALWKKEDLAETYPSGV